MRRKIIGFIAAVLTAGLATFALVAYVRGAEHRAVAGEELVDVFVVKQQIRAGSPAAAVAALVRPTQVPVKVRAKGAVTDFKQLEGLVAAVDLVEGEQIVVGRFVNPAVDQLQRTGLVAVPEGLREVTMKLDPERALGGQLRPGDSVAVVASFTPFDIADAGGAAAPNGADKKTPNTSFTTLHKVLVTRVQTVDPATSGSGSRIATGSAVVDPAPRNSLFVTLAVDTPSLERLVFAAEFGRVWLSYEPQSSTDAGSLIVTRNNVYVGSETKS